MLTTMVDGQRLQAEGAKSEVLDGGGASMNVGQVCVECGGGQGNVRADCLSRV